MFAFLDVPIDVAYHIVSALAAGLHPVAGSLAAAVAIVMFTAAVRLLLMPLSLYALRGQAGVAALQTQVQDLQRCYGKQPDRLQRELTALYKENGGAVLGGCLPLLLQVPFFSVMYRLFRSTTVDGRPNTLLAHELLGVPLGSRWLEGPGPLSAHGLVFLGLFALLAIVGWGATRLSRRLLPAPAGTAAPAAGGRAGATAGPAPAAGGSAVPAAETLAQVSKIMPYLSIAFAAFVPLAAGVYLLTSASWSLAERAVLRRMAAPPARPAEAPDPAGRPGRAAA
jgi:YidC/Oxa1 family membrane protein insertase